MRRRAAEKRVIIPDMKYNSVLLAKFMNKIMRAGNKALAENIVYSSFNKIQSQFKLEPFEVFNQAMNNVKPYLEVSSVRVGGANYQVPSQVDERRGYALASKWIIDSASKRSEKSMIDRLTQELFEASNNRGGSIKKKDETHRMAEANKAFAHFSARKMTR